MVPLAARKVVHSVGDDMGMEQRPGAGDVLVLHGLASGAELIHDLLHMDRVPDHGNGFFRWIIRSVPPKNAWPRSRKGCAGKS